MNLGTYVRKSGIKKGHMNRKKKESFFSKKKKEKRKRFLWKKRGNVDIRICIFHHYI